MIPVAHSLEFNDMKIMLGTIGSVLTGAIWGNHCSPIAESCILTSMSIACDHADNVKSQIVYATIIGSITFCIGSIPCGLFSFYTEWLALTLCKLLSKLINLMFLSIGLISALAVLVIFGGRVD